MGETNLDRIDKTINHYCLECPYLIDGICKYHLENITEDRTIRQECSKASPSFVLTL